MLWLIRVLVQNSCPYESNNVIYLHRCTLNNELKKQEKPCMSAAVCNGRPETVIYASIVNSPLSSLLPARRLDGKLRTGEISLAAISCYDIIEPLTVKAEL